MNSFFNRKLDNIEQQIRMNIRNFILPMNLEECINEKLARKNDLFAVQCINEFIEENFKDDERTMMVTLRVKVPRKFDDYKKSDIEDIVLETLKVGQSDAEDSLENDSYHPLAELAAKIEVKLR